MTTIKRCFVPVCTNNIVKTPGKIFITVPADKTRRQSWCQAVGFPKTQSHRLYCCEDHFKLAEDCENWRFFTTIGDRIKLKQNVVPHLNITKGEVVQLEQQLTPSARKRKLEVRRTLGELSKRLFPEEVASTRAHNEVSSSSGYFTAEICDHFEDFTVINTPIIYVPCQESVQTCFVLLEDCLVVEETIEKYCEAEGVNSEGVIELTHVREYTSRNNLRSEDIEEGKYNDESLMEMDELKLNNVQQSVSNNTLISKEECKEDEMVVAGGTIYVERDIKVEHENENFDELEDQKLNSIEQSTSELDDNKYLIPETIEIKTEPSDFNS